MQALICLVLGDLFVKTEGEIQTLRAENLTQVSKDGSGGHSKEAITVVREAPGVFRASVFSVDLGSLALQHSFLTWHLTSRR